MSTIQYRLDIQGLRAIAVLAVMAFHFNPRWLPGGFIGVDVFLVISGFLIVRILLAKKKQADYRIGRALQYFYSSRLKRIAPAYFMMLVLVSLFAAILFLPQDLATYRNSMQAATWFHSNSYFAHFGDYFAPATHEQPLLHTWSLAVEVQFYLLAPFLVLLLPIRALKWVFLTLFMGFTALAQYRLQVLGIQQATYYSLYARLPEFFAGALVALALRAEPAKKTPVWAGYFGLTLIFIAALTQPQLGPFPGLSAWLPAGGAALLLLYPAQGIAQKLLSNRLMVWVGELSYSLYLWHWPVLALLRYYTGTQILDLTLSLLFILLTFTLATLSFYGIEAPLRTMRTREKQIRAYSALIFATLLIGISIKPINQFFSPPQLQIEYARYADPATICHGQIVGDCLKGDLSSAKEVLVLGDSHAAMLNLFFDQLGKELGFKARILTASSCVTIPGFDYQRLPEWAHQPCLAQIKEAEKNLPAATVIFLAANWEWQLGSSEFQHRLKEFLAKENKGDRKIYLMGQVPLLKNNPARAQRFHMLGLPSGTSISPKYQAANQQLASYETHAVQMVRVDLESAVLREQRGSENDGPFYMDEQHLNEVGARRYAEMAQDTFKRLMK